MLFRCFCLFVFTCRILWKKSLPPLHVSSQCSFPTFSQPPPTFASAPFPNDSTVLCVHDQGECFRLYVGVETTRRLPPVGRFQKRVPLANGTTPLSLTDSLKQVATLPPPSATPPSTWMPSSAINHPKLINTNKTASWLVTLICSTMSHRLNSEWSNWPFIFN